MPDTYSEADLSACLTSLGIREGDCVFIHSSLKGVGKLETSDQDGMLHALLVRLLSAVGETGTLVSPTFNFGFCEGQTFDRQNTPAAGMGAFAEYFRTYPGAIRSKHPFQCISAIGRQASRIANAEGRSAFSDGGPFDAMLALDCRILFFGVDFVETFVHVSEERAAVPYRFWKTFTSTYVDEGVSRQLSVDFFARNLEIVPEPFLDKPKFNRLLRGAGVIKGVPLGAGQVSICRAVELVDTLTAVLKEEPLGFLLGR